MRLIKLLSCALLLGLAATAQAEGTVDFKDDVLPMLNHQPVFARFLLGTFSIDDTGWGVRIGEQAMPRLGGARMGPYRFQARWHSGQGDEPVTLVIETTVKFYDREGREVRDGDLRRAAKLIEEFDSIKVKPPR